MKLETVELVRLAMPLVAPFQTSFGIQTTREALLVHVATEDGAEGWGECVAKPEPMYSSEYLDSAAHVIQHFLLPRLAAAPDFSAESVAALLAPVRGHRMSKAAVEMAVLDAQLLGRGQSFGRYLGVTRTRVPAGVSVGIMDSIPALLDAVDGYVDEGYQRIKLKIQPGWDLAPVAAVRERIGDLPLQVDANAAYTLADAGHLRRLDDFDLLLIEQPLGEEDIRQHAELARWVQTPICLDESVVSAQAAADAIALGAARVINIKPGRVGGYLEAQRIHDLCRAHGVAAWCGGMLETGLGRAANIALAGLPGFTLPGDISASGRFYATDITEPRVLEAGHQTVPTQPGIGARPIPEAIDEFVTNRTRVGSWS
jgi:O-succinylbenzoate synthase